VWERECVPETVWAILEAWVCGRENVWERECVSLRQKQRQRQRERERERVVCGIREVQACERERESRALVCHSRGPDVCWTESG